MKTLAGKTTLITGGASGIGLGMARAFARAGARVALGDVDAAALERARRELADTGAEVLSLLFDVSVFEAWLDAERQVSTTLGPIDVLCNNAGVGAHSAFVAEFDPKAWRRVIEVNLTGAFYGCRTILPGMIARGDEGHIVFTASLAGLRSDGLLSAYAASKHGLIGLSDALRAELRGSSVGVSVLCPGMTRTNFRSDPSRLLGAPGAEAPSAYEALAKKMPFAMDPDLVGERVVHAVLDGDYHIFTHVDARPDIERIFAERLVAFDRARSGLP